MLNFSALTLDDRARIDPFLQRDGMISTERTFSSLYIWGEHYQICTCQFEDILFMKSCPSEYSLAYYMPLGGDPARAMALLQADAAERGRPYEIIAVSESGKAALETVCPGQFTITEMRKDFEYIYHAEDMIGLKGKKYHGKRNFVNRFKAAYNGRWAYAPVEPSRDDAAIMAFMGQWCEEQPDMQNQDYRFEYSAIRRALEHYETLNMRGGVLRLDDKIIAFTLATPQNATVMDILIEKADYDIEGAYQMINNQFAMRECGGYAYINREEDMGIEGLRTAKMSYHPASLTAKYRAVPR
jgi:hypothetical protein